eukprot:TRINITY_DN23658_c0_g1_i1.p1 TRINITY_DN23658_c0_g1~~TRINITY_DN23658_c0_g1_i1.p1  ORF type:complete len:643 (+),score=57.77 TRINITY_DN23658_c0_g1_i1:39-1967(+)
MAAALRMNLLVFSFLNLVSSFYVATGETPSHSSVYPQVWGGSANAPPGGVLGGCSGHMFGFSGMDGATDEEADFVGVATGDGYSLKFCGLKAQRTLILRTPSENNTVNVATGDVLIVQTHGHTLGSGLMTMTWASAAVLIGAVPPGSDVLLDNAKAWSHTSPASVTCSVHEAKEDTLAFCSLPSTMQTLWALARSSLGPEDAVKVAQSAIGNMQLDAVVAERLISYQALPQVENYQMLLAKSLSVMRVNSLSPEGKIKQHWSTPDRMPHRWMWLWDSCFHSLPMNNFVSHRTTSGPNLSWEYIKSVLDGADEYGGVAIVRTPTDIGSTVVQTQPPLLAWAVWENYMAGKRFGLTDQVLIDRLKFAAPKLVGYLQWNIRERSDRTRATPLLVWTMGTESGMDNSQRFDSKTHAVDSMLAVDFSVFFAREAQFTSKIADVIGNTAMATEWKEIGAKVSQAVHSILWDESSGMYMDMHGPRQSTGVKSVMALLPMWLDDFPMSRLPKLLDAIHDKKLFGTKVPLPSVARETSTFSTDMWRGPMWLNTNYMIAEALLSKNETHEAIALMRASVDVVFENYKKYGVIFEFYDADGVSDPRSLLRKGVRTGGVRDYHWSAALTYNMILKLKALNALTLKRGDGSVMLV